jgi:hypothetical protein
MSFLHNRFQTLKVRPYHCIEDQQLYPRKSPYRSRSQILTRARLPPDTQPPSHRAQSYGGHRDTNTHALQRPYGSMSSKAFCRPRVPPPPPPEPQQCGSWNQSQHGNQDHDVSRGSPTRSEGSNHTMAGSDFEPEKPNSSTEKENPLVPALARSDSSFSRKRSYEEDTDHGDEKSRQQEDHTKRKRRSQVDAAYR